MSSSSTSAISPDRGNNYIKSSSSNVVDNINCSSSSNNKNGSNSNVNISEKIRCLSEILHNLDDSKARSARAATPSQCSSLTPHVVQHVWPQYLSTETAANGSVTTRPPSRGSYSQHLYSHIPYNHSNVDTENHHHHHHHISPYQLSIEKPPPSPYADELLQQQYCRSKSLIRSSDNFYHGHNHHHHHNHHPYLTAALDGSHDQSRSFLYPSASNSSPLSATSQDIYSISSMPLNHLPSCNMASEPQRRRPSAEPYDDDDDHRDHSSGMNALAQEILTRLKHLEQSQNQAVTGTNAKPRVSKRRSNPPRPELHPRMIHGRRRTSALRSIKHAAEEPVDDHTCDTDTKGETSSLDLNVSDDQLVKQVQRLETEVQLCWSAINQLCIDNELFREEQRRWSRYINPTCLWGDDTVTKKTKTGAKKDHDYDKKTKRKGFVEDTRKEGEAL